MGRVLPIRQFTSRRHPAPGPADRIPADNERDVAKAPAPVRSCRRGIGRRLWQAVRRGVAARNGAAVTLWVLQGNHAAQRFYQAQGFVADGQHKTLTLDGTRLAERRYVWPAARLR